MLGFYIIKHFQKLVVLTSSCAEYKDVQYILYGIATWNMRYKKWQQDRFFSEYFRCPLPLIFPWGQDGIVGRANRCWLECPGLEPRWRQEIFSFPYPSRPALGPTQTPLRWIQELFPRVKQPGSVVDCLPNLALNLRLSRAIHLLAFCASLGMLRSDLYS